MYLCLTGTALPALRTIWQYRAGKYLASTRRKYKNSAQDLAISISASCLDTDLLGLHHGEYMERKAGRINCMGMMHAFAWLSSRTKVVMRFALGGLEFPTKGLAKAKKY